MYMDQPIRIVLTGGPCAGKTTAIARVAEQLATLGRPTVVVPEAASLFINAGISFACSVQERQVRQQALLRQQLATEDNFIEAAKSCGENVVVLMDRGIMDSAAYVPTEMWRTMLSSLSLHEAHMRDTRYDAVIHMVTAASGAEEYYTLANNMARSEPSEAARLIDDKIQQAWREHRYFRVIDNSTDFAHKIDRTISEVLNFLGISKAVTK